MKAHISLGLDVDIIELAKAKQINISDVVNTYLKQYLLVDEKKLPKEEDLLIERRAEIQAETNIIEAKLRKFKEEKAAIKVEELRKRQEYEEKIRTGRIVEWKY